MDIETFIKDWIIVSNKFDTEKYLEFYLDDAVLNDPSVGRKFLGHAGIKDYFQSYFIGYKTHSVLRKLKINGNSGYLEVDFTGEFPEGKIRGSFDFIIKKDKIAYLTADLIP